MKEYFFSEIWHDKRLKFIFFSVLVGLIFAHAMAIFNKYSVHDDTISLFSTGATISSGRWGLELLRLLPGILFGTDGGSSTYSMPVVASIYVVIFSTLSLFLVVKLLDIKSIVSCIFLGGIFITSPFYISLFGHVFAASSYSFAIFLSVFASYMLCRYKKWYVYIVSVLLIVLSLGIYQAFLSIIISLMLFHMIKETVVNAKQTWIDFLKIGFYYVTACVLSITIYILTVKLSCYLTNVELTSYKNINNMAKEGFFAYISRIPLAYYKFFNPNDFFPLNTKYIYRILLGIEILLSIYLYYKLQKQQSMKFITLIVMIPIVCNLPLIMTENVDRASHTIVLLGQLFPIIFLLQLLEEKYIKQIMLMRLISYVCIGIIIIMYCRIANIFYLKIEFVQQRSFSYFTTLVTQIKNVDGYDDDYPVVYLNEFKKRDKNIKGLPFMYYTIPPYFCVKDMINNYSWKIFVSNWLGFDPRLGKAKDFKYLPEVKDMPHYPDSGSIKIINENVVVKF